MPFIFIAADRIGARTTHLYFAPTAVQDCVASDSTCNAVCLALASQVQTTSPSQTSCGCPPGPASPASARAACSTTTDSRHFGGELPGATLCRAVLLCVACCATPRCAEPSQALPWQWAPRRPCCAVLICGGPCRAVLWRAVPSSFVRRAVLWRSVLRRRRVVPGGVVPGASTALCIRRPFSHQPTARSLRIPAAPAAPTAPRCPPSSMAFDPSGDLGLALCAPCTSHLAPRYVAAVQRSRGYVMGVKGMSTLSVDSGLQSRGDVWRDPGWVQEREAAYSQIQSRL